MTKLTESIERNSLPLSEWVLIAVLPVFLCLCVVVTYPFMNLPSDNVTTTTTLTPQIIDRSTIIVMPTLTPLLSCEFNNLLVSKIKRFEIYGVGSSIIDFLNGSMVLGGAKIGEHLTVGWDISNATNIAVIIEDPTGDVSILSREDASDRADFLVTEWGNYIISVYDNNTLCPVRVKIDIVPPK